MTAAAVDAQVRQRKWLADEESEAKSSHSLTCNQRIHPQPWIRHLLRKRYYHPEAEQAGPAQPTHIDATILHGLQAERLPTQGSVTAQQGRNGTNSDKIFS